MSFVPMRQLLTTARESGYAVGAFNVFNMESLQAVVETAVEERSPVIIMCEQRDVGYAGLKYLYNLALASLETAAVPVTLHFDHGNDVKLINCAIETGFSSIMIDGSELPFAENVSLTRKIVEYAKLRAAISLGIAKINVGTDLRRTFIATFAKFAHDQSLDVRDVLIPCKQAMKEIIRDRMNVFGSRGKVSPT